MDETREGEGVAVAIAETDLAVVGADESGSGLVVERVTDASFL